MLSSDTSILYHQPCDTCRRRKVKCDRSLPQCSRCVKYSYPCSYFDNLKRKGPKKGSKLDLACTINPFFDSLFQVASDSSRSQEENEQLLREQSTIITLKKPINFKNCTKSSIDTILNALLSNSIIDRTCKVQISATGKVKYCGDSPMALILTTYSLHHPSPSAMTALFRKLSKPNGCETNVSLKLSTPIIQIGISAYFQYFHPFTPIIDKRNFFLNYSSQSILLVYTIASIGIGYIPKLANFKKPLSEQVSRLIRQSYLKPSISSLTALTLVAFYQHHNKEFSKGWFYLGIAMRFAYALGLNQTSNDQIRIRIWWWLHILDKLYAFSMDRPWIFDTRQAKIKQCEVSECDFLNEADHQKNFDQLQQEMLHSNLLSELCHLQCLMVRKFKFTELAKYDDYSQLEKLCRITAEHMNLFHVKVENKFSVYRDNLTNQSSPFETVLKIIYYGTLIQLYQLFSGTTDLQLHAHYYGLSLKASIKVVELTLSLKEQFFYCGITYRFYCLGTAIMFLIRSFKDNSCPETFLLIRNGITLLENCKVYYDLAHEFANLTKIIAQVETLL